jgi:hypothetical protein
VHWVNPARGRFVKVYRFSFGHYFVGTHHAFTCPKGSPSNIGYRVDFGHELVGSEIGHVCRIFTAFATHITWIREHKNSVCILAHVYDLVAISDYLSDSTRRRGLQIAYNVVGTVLTAYRARREAKVIGAHEHTV